MKRIETPEPIWITSEAELAKHCANWLQESYLAIDTEFIRTSTFYPKAGLIQVGDSHHSYLIDPLLIHDWTAFAQVLVHPFVVKVFHACLEDLEVCRCLTGELPSPLVDTQIAAALVGMAGSLSYQNLLKEVLKIDLPKEETRSNWLERPLRSEQVAYAVADVHFLHKAFAKLAKKLKELKRETWLSEDCERLLRQFTKAEQPSSYVQRIKLAWKLNGQELLLLQQLSIWREQTARKINVPRGYVMSDDALWNIARFKPQSAADLARADVPANTINKREQELTDLVAQVLKLPKNLWPKVLPKPMSRQAGELLKKLKQLVAQRAQQLAIPSDTLCAKKSLKELVKSGYGSGQYRLPEALQGWRKAEIGDALIAYLIHNTDRNTIHDVNENPV
ncbi:MAG: ribonuclease D [Venatoribacter sp.]